MKAIFSCDPFVGVDLLVALDQIQHQDIHFVPHLLQQLLNLMHGLCIKCGHHVHFSEVDTKQSCPICLEHQHNGALPPAVRFFYHPEVQHHWQLLTYSIPHLPGQGVSGSGGSSSWAP